MATAWGYARCSTDMQDNSIDDQKMEIQKYAEEHDYVFIEPRWFVDEGRSGISIEKREGFQNLITAAERAIYALPDVLLVYDVSRWGRYIDADEAAYWEYSLKRQGIRIIYTHEQFSNDTSMASATMKAIRRSTSTDYVRRLSMLTTRGSKTTAMAGYWNGAMAPYGYARLLLDENDIPITVLEKGKRKYQSNHRVKLTPGNPDEIEIVKRIFDCYSCRGMGGKSIVNMLNEEGIPSATGKQWGTSIVHRILSNPVYIGTIVWGKTKGGKFSRLENTWNDTNPTSSMHDRDKWVVCENAHEPLVSRDTFQRVQEIKKQRDCFRPGTGGRTNGSPYLLTGIMSCSHCGHKMKGRTLRTGGKTYQYYEDGGFHQKGKTYCSNIWLRREWLDDFVLDRIAQRLENQVWVERIEERLREKLSGSANEDGITQIEQQLKDVDAKVEGLLDVAESGVASVKKRLIQREQEQKELKRKLTELKDSKIEPEDINVTIRELIEACGNWQELLSKGTQDEKKQLIRNFVKEVVVDRETDSINYYFYKTPVFSASRTRSSSCCPIRGTDGRNHGRAFLRDQTASEWSTPDPARKAY